MAIPHAEKLILKAQGGEKLSTSERRHCIAFLMTTKPDETNYALADLFKISETMVRKDKLVIRQDRAKMITDDDIGLVIADIAMSFDQQVRDIESSKKKCKMGKRDYLEHCKVIFDIQLKKVKALQDLGYYPKNLGNMTIDKFEYRAHVSVEDGSVETRLVDDFEESQLLEAKFEVLPPPK